MSKKITPEELLSRIEELGQEDLRNLDRWIHLRLKELEAGQARAGPPGEPAESQPGKRRTYRQVYTRCGKPDCHCASGEGHGPYWYAYWWEDGKVRSKYVGKNLDGVD